MKKFMFLLMISIFLIGTSTPAFADNQTSNTFDLSKIDEIVESQIETNIFPGASVMVKLGSEVLYEKSYGDAYLYDMGKLLTSPVKATNDTMYDLASVTKVTATTQAAMMLVYQGLLDLDEPIATYWPEFQAHNKESITMRDLLTHTSGLPQWVPSFLYVSTRADEKDFIADMELLWTPGSVYKYSDFGLMTAAFTIESIVNKPIDTYLHENLYAPLGMDSTMFTPLKHGVSVDRIAATSWGNPYEWRMSNEAEYPGYGYDTSADAEAFLAFDGWREYTLRGEVNDGNAAMANEGIAGHAGLFSTIGDLSILGEMMLNGGTYNGKVFYDQATIDEFTTAASDRFNRGLGWQIGGASKTSGYVGQYATSSVFSHAGFTGTQYILDSDYDLQVIFLTNKQNVGHDNGNYKSPYKASRDIMDLVYESIFEKEAELRTSIQDKMDQYDALDKTLYDVDSTQDAVSVMAELEGTFNISAEKYAALVLMNNRLDTALASMKLLNFENLDAALLEAKNVDKDTYTS